MEDARLWDLFLLFGGVWLVASAVALTVLAAVCFKQARQATAEPDRSQVIATADIGTAARRTASGDLAANSSR